ncbi:MAG: hypothetical protein HY775_05770 [Acidobacteria bacterium]|nr:hypothetical protein [Acidobacteriota bacterium]
MAEEGKKRSKKGLCTMLAAIAAGVFFFLKKRKREDESAWEEATPDSHN